MLSALQNANSFVSVTMLCCAVWSIATPASAQSAPHAVHGARFGGAFATAASDTLHVEALWSEQRRLRVFIVDAAGEPLPLEQLRAFNASVATGDRESPLTLVELGGYFEARIATLTLPATMTVKLKPSATGPEEQLTVSFRGYSPAINEFGTESPAEIPRTLAGILGALATERTSAQAVVEHEEFPALLGSEDRIRDLVLAIEPYLEPLAAAARIKAQSAITQVVRACWLLHTVLDYGGLPQRDAALKQLGDALDLTFAAVAGIAR